MVDKHTQLSEVMTPNPVTLPIKATVLDAARCMQTEDIGDVVVLDGEQACGIVTDRDLVVRVMAENLDLEGTSLSDICTKNLVSLNPTDTVGQAVDVMGEKAIRRLVVVDDGKPVGVVSLGDLAIDAHGEAALADISAAPPNN